MSDLAAHFIRRAGPSRAMLRCAAIVSVLAVGSLVAGCSDVKAVGGTKPNLEALEGTLRIGESSAAEVRAALGEPTGSGMMMQPIDDSPRTMWSYYYERDRFTGAGGGDSRFETRRTFLFVFFKDGRYDGYMWFSSHPK